MQGRLFQKYYKYYIGDELEDDFDFIILTFRVSDNRVIYLMATALQIEST